MLLYLREEGEWGERKKEEGAFLHHFYLLLYIRKKLCESRRSDKCREEEGYFVSPSFSLEMPMRTLCLKTT